MSRCIVNVATGRYQIGQQRLKGLIQETTSFWTKIASQWPTHERKPYAMKAYALKHAAEHGATQLLWCDACIIPIRSLEPIWEYAHEHGVWIGRNYGFTNYEWTADSAYGALFPGVERAVAQLANYQIPHVIATAFALDLEHEKGRAFLDEYYRLASETDAFCGPWINSNYTADFNTRAAPCGPEDVRGHRHDQTAASVIAWRLGIPLTDPPKFFQYKGGETEETILVADGAY